MYCTGTGKKTPGGAGTHSNLNHGQDTAHTCQISTADRTRTREPDPTHNELQHTYGTQATRAHTGKRIPQNENLTTIQTHQHENLTTMQAHQHTRTTSRRPWNPRPAQQPTGHSRSPGAERSLERSPRPTQKRPPAAHGRLPLPERLPAPARTPSWLAPRRHARRGRRNMKARAADAQQTRSGRRCGRSPR